MVDRTSAVAGSAIGQSSVRALAWDSDHFGFQVGEIVSPTLCDEDLAAALTFAGNAGHRLVYWSTQPNRNLPDWFDAFGARRVNHRVQYSADLNSDQAESKLFAIDPQMRIVACPPGPAGESLTELAIRAGAHSRFHVDPRVPLDRFESLYQIWVDRSTRRELADQVFVATPSGAVDEAVGFITVSENGGAGRIGLLAVHPNHRGRGIGGLLIENAHSWMRKHEVRTVSVVTQLENIPACRLYARWNYAPINIQAWFHFWLDSGMHAVETQIPDRCTGAV